MRTASYIKVSLLAALVLFVGTADAGRDGSGTYSLPAGNPVSTGTVISSTWANTTLSDIATGLSNSLAKDGQTVPTANLPMGGFKHTGVADGTARNHYSSVGQVQDFSVQTLASVAGTNTITGVLSPSITSYATGALVGFTPANTNTGATTIAINGLAARSIVRANGDALFSRDLVSGSPALIQATATQFVLLNPPTMATIVASKTATTSRASTTTFTADPHLTTTLPAGIYSLHAVLTFNEGGAGAFGGIKVGLTFSGTVNSAYGGVSQVGGTVLNFSSLLDAAGVFTSSAVRDTPVADSILIYGTFDVSVSGTLAITWAQQVSNGTNTSMLSGSHFILTKIG
jgi:hypothetical protein